jgi:hypothetical protein
VAEVRAQREQDAGFVNDRPDLSGGLNHTAMTATADKISCARATGAESATTTKPQPPATISTEGTRLCRRFPLGSSFVIIHALECPA